MIVPLVLHGFDLDHTLLMKFFVPQLGNNLSGSVWPVASEVVVLAGLMVWRWQLVRQPLGIAED